MDTTFLAAGIPRFGSPSPSSQPSSPSLSHEQEQQPPMGLFAAVFPPEFTDTSAQIWAYPLEQLQPPEPLQPSEPIPNPPRSSAANTQHQARHSSALANAEADSRSPPSAPNTHQSAEGLLLKSSLALSSNNPYVASFADDTGNLPADSDSPHRYSPDEPEPDMAAFDVSSFSLDAFTAYNDEMKIDTTGRPSISLSSRTHASHASNASYDSAATATSTTTVAPDAGLESGPESDSESDSESDTDGATQDADSDSDSGLPLALALLRNDDGSLGAQGLVGATPRETASALFWTDVAPPAALLELPPDMLPDVPELLRAIVQSSVESIQAQVPVLKEAAAAVQERARQEDADAPNTEGKGKEVMAESTATLRPPTISMTTTTTATTSTTSTTTTEPKKSKRKMLASTFRRLRGNSSGNSSSNGESSAQGEREGARSAAAAAAIRRHNQLMAGRGATPGYKWVRGGHGQSWDLVAEEEEDDSNGIAATSTDPGSAPISDGRRRNMLLAIVKQDVGKSSPKDAAPKTVECISCFEDVPAKHAVRTACHAYCLACFAQLVACAVDNEAQFPPKCCLNHIPAATVHKYAPRDVARRYDAKAAEFAVPVADRVYCPVVDCGVFVPAAQIAAAARTAHCRNGHQTCTACRHPGLHDADNRGACPEASAQDRRDQLLADNLARDEGWRRCIACAVLIEHREACQHMTCRCGAQFCYVCGSPWRTCACSMDDLLALKDGVAARRRRREQDAEERAAQADRELADVRDALRQVAEFEREATDRRAADRAHQRQRLHGFVEQRTRALRADTAHKYAALRAALAALADAQGVRARTARGAERTDQRTAQEQEQHALAQTHAAERAAAERDAAAAIAASEAFWQADYRARLRLERRLESAYGAQAHTDHKSLRAYQRQNDARLDAYEQWRDRALAQARLAAAQARDVRAQVLAVVQRKQARAHRAAARALAQRHRAERVWCLLAAAERERMLAEVEAMEQALGLAASAAETDATLLVLLEMEEGRSGGGGDGGDGDDDSSDESDQLYAVLLDAVAGQMDEPDGQDGQDREDGAEGFEYWTGFGTVTSAEAGEEWEDARDFLWT